MRYLVGEYNWKSSSKNCIFEHKSEGIFSKNTIKEFNFSSLEDYSDVFYKNAKECIEKIQSFLSNSSFNHYPFCDQENHKIEILGINTKCSRCIVIEKDDLEIDVVSKLKDGGYIVHYWNISDETWCRTDEFMCYESLDSAISSSVKIFANKDYTADRVEKSLRENHFLSMLRSTLSENIFIYQVHLLPKPKYNLSSDLFEQWSKRKSVRPNKGIKWIPLSELYFKDK